VVVVAVAAVAVVVRAAGAAVLAVGTAADAVVVEEAAVQQALYPAGMLLAAIPGVVAAEQLDLGTVTEEQKPENLKMKLLAVRQWLAEGSLLQAMSWLPKVHRYQNG